jgi:hypothetical protein
MKKVQERNFLRIHAKVKKKAFGIPPHATP